MATYKKEFLKQEALQQYIEESRVEDEKRRKQQGVPEKKKDAEIVDEVLPVLFVDKYPEVEVSFEKCPPSSIYPTLVGKASATLYVDGYRLTFNEIPVVRSTNAEYGIKLAYPKLIGINGLSVRQAYSFSKKLYNIIMYKLQNYFLKKLI